MGSEHNTMIITTNEKEEEEVGEWKNEHIKKAQDSTGILMQKKKKVSWKSCTQVFN